MEPKKQVYTHQEKKVFLEILKNYSKIVENKHTNVSAINAKNTAWQKIALEFNASPHANLHRTPKQLRRLWMNLKHRERDVVARHYRSQMSRPGEQIPGSDVLHIAHAIMTSMDSSMDSDIVIETIANDPIQAETSVTNLYLSEDSAGTPNRGIPLFSSVKIEQISPSNSIDTSPVIDESPPQPPIKKVHNSPHQENCFTQDKTHKRLPEMEIHILEMQLLKEKIKIQQQESMSREARALAIHNIEYQILKEKLREATAKANLAELSLKRQQYPQD